MAWVLLLIAALVAPRAAPLPAQSPSAPSLDFEFFRSSVEPILLARRSGNVRCVTCHAGGASSQLRLQPLTAGATSFSKVAKAWL